jgi:hypothetical protein
VHIVFDHVLFGLLLLAPLVEWRWNWPRYLRRLAAGIPGVRLGYYRNVILGEWLPTLVLVAAWATALVWPVAGQPVPVADRRWLRLRRGVLSASGRAGRSDPEEAADA